MTNEMLFVILFLSGFFGYTLLEEDTFLRRIALLSFIMGLTFITSYSILEKLQ